MSAEAPPLPYPPGWYYTGHVTKESIEAMPEHLRVKFTIGTALSNTSPFPTKQAAVRDAQAHHLRDITAFKI